MRIPKMKQVNIRLSDDDISRLDFVVDYLEKEGLAYGPSTPSKAVRYALRQIVNIICNRIERQVKERANSPIPFQPPQAPMGDNHAEERSNPDRPPDE